MKPLSALRRSRLLCLQILSRGLPGRGQAGVAASQIVLLGVLLTGANDAQGAPSIAREWNERILQNIRNDSPNPPVHARNLFHLSICMYDAWAAYDNVAVGYLYHGKATAADVAAARREAISYAAWRLLKERYVFSRTATNTLIALDAKMVALGYDTNNASRDPATPAGLGNLIYDTVSAHFLNDGSLQTNAFQDVPYNNETGEGYSPINPPLATGVTNTGTGAVDVNRWQPLSITDAVDQNGFPQAPIQKFVGSQWLKVWPFALQRTNASLPWIDPGPQPKLAGVGHEQFRADVVELITKSSYMVHGDTNMIDISPGVFGNNSLGANDGTGHPVNPYTGQPYAPNIVRRGDFARVLAEYWADGPSSETPPGHWNAVANYVSDQPATVKRIGGVGPVVDDLEWDVKLYFTLNAAVHDAACVAWSIKRYYDGGRPITYIRYMANLGQSSSNSAPSYNVNGLPLVNGLIELVTLLTSQPGQRHAGLSPNRVAIRCWSGPLPNPTNHIAGVKWIDGRNWMPFQRATFVTPAFPGYLSGHSTFSRAAAEVLAGFTGTNYFPGGLGSFTAVATNYLTIEQGPTETVHLQYATYFDAADQAGMSRIYGGIHPSSDDFPGRRAGSQAGTNVWFLAQKYFNGSITNHPVQLVLRSLGPGSCEVSYETLRGFSYALQSTIDLTQPFTNEPGGFYRATDTFTRLVQSPPSPRKYYRLVRAQSP